MLDTQTDRQQQLHTLRILNWVAAALHLGLALAGVSFVIDRGSVVVPGFWGTAEWNSTRCQELGYGQDVPVYPNLDPAAAGRRAIKINFSLVLICSQAITAAAHTAQALLARPGSFYDTWTLDYGVKLLSWVEYVFTGALTDHVLIYYGGMLDIRTQVIGYAAQGTLMVVGLTQDLLRLRGLEQPHDLMVCKALIGFLFALGFFNLSSVWFSSLYTLWVDPPSDPTPPDFVKWIVLVEFLLYSSFGIAQLVFMLPFLVNTQTYTRRFFTEQVVLDALSFASKLVLNVAFSTCFVYRMCGGDD